jgi:GNAT superfamily N-acetyltransferase
MELTIRPVETTEMGLLLGLIREKAVFDGCPEAVMASEPALHDALFGDDPKAGVLLALADSMPVGFVSYYRTFSTFLARPGLWMDDLFVRDDWRNRAIGRALVAALADRVVGMDGGRLEWTAARTNEAGLRFYERQRARVQETVHLLRLDGDDLVAITRAA